MTYNIRWTFFFCQMFGRIQSSARCQVNPGQAYCPSFLGTLRSVTWYWTRWTYCSFLGNNERIRISRMNMQYCTRSVGTIGKLKMDRSSLATPDSKWSSGGIVAWMTSPLSQGASRQNQFTRSWHQITNHPSLPCNCFTASSTCIFRSRFESIAFEISFSSVPILDSWIATDPRARVLFNRGLCSSEEHSCAGQFLHVSMVSNLDCIPPLIGSSWQGIDVKLHAAILEYLTSGPDLPPSETR